MDESTDVPKTTLDQHFTRFYSIEHDICVCRHNNGILMLMIAEHHSVIKNLSSIAVEKIEFRDVAQVSGKRKRGGTTIQDGTKLASVFMSDGTVIEVRSPVRGVLLEINDALCTKPELIQNDPFNRGYLCTVLPMGRNDLKDAQKSCIGLIPKQDYFTRKQHPDINSLSTFPAT
uniref:Protein Abitram n=1 Tax=Timspurckia oligopyrenoides TaxID=708627 RepID=A0A7S0ZEJ5_9RHOD